MIKLKELSLLSFVILITQFSFAQSGADSLLSFLGQNKSRVSFYLKKNDFVIAKMNEDRQMPLASTVKMMVAIEFAKQAGAGIFNEDSLLSLQETAKYYIPNTNDNAHATWLDFETKKGHLKNDSIKLIEIARGMIMFNSNANTEYLMDLLGFDNVKNNIQLLGLKKHSGIYPPVASLFLYQNPGHFPEDKILKEIKRMSDQEYCKYIFFIHNQLKNDSNYKKHFRPEDLTLKAQKVWSSRLSSSTTKEYVQICSILNNRSYFDSNTYGVVAGVLESVMEDTTHSQWLAHAGMKEGSTNFVLTKALYATLKSGTKIELAYFLNNLTTQENMKLQGWMNDFEGRILKDDAFCRQISRGNGLM